MRRFRRITFIAARFILGFLFLIAAFGKLSAPGEFAQSILNYRVFGEWLSNWIAVILPPLEFILGIFFIFGIWLETSFLLALGLYLVFDLMILQAYFRHLDIMCGCFGSAAAAGIGLQKIVENSVLTVLAVWGWWVIRKKPIKTKRTPDVAEQR